MTKRAGFLAYATANDRLGYVLDAKNVRRLVSLNPAAEPIDICLAVSEVTPRSKLDVRWYRTLADEFERGGRFRVIDVIFKTNIGRDFSSWKVCLEKIARVAQPDEFVLMLNRSASGPMLANWYTLYTEPFVRYPDLGICGSSINFEFKAHVQTYAWMTRMGIIERLMEDFPGERARTRREAIFNGEIELSQRLIARGYRIAALAWPDELFGAARMHEPQFPQFDLSADLEDVPFRHWNKSEISSARLDAGLHLARMWMRISGRFGSC